MSQGHLISSIINAIQNSNGFISFSKFMEIALYEYDHGYYMSTREIFGKAGDFVTAPLISPLFAGCLARQCQEVLAKLENGCIIEIGAGTGTLAKDLLLTLEKLNTLPDIYFIYEISKSLREKQQAYLRLHCEHLFSKIVWLEKLAPLDCNGIVIANEVLDALPVHCFTIAEAGYREKGVTYKDQKFSWFDIASGNQEVNTKVMHLKNAYQLPTGYTSEINLSMQSWIKEVAALLKQGIILLFDYGYHQREYYHPDRTMGTLMCHTAHQRHDNPFINIGLQDITAHVDFTAVMEYAALQNLSLQGYTTQSGFLLSLGITEHAPTLSSVQQYQQAQAIKKLILPGEMGEIIKVMALGKNFEMSLQGFSLVDRRRDL